MSVEDNVSTDQPEQPVTHAPVTEEASTPFGRPIPSGVEASEDLPNPQVMSWGLEEGSFSTRSLTRYLNPAEALRGYGRFLKRTVKRFGPAEIAGTATALGAAYMANRFYPGAWGSWGTATAGAMGENIGFHGLNATKKYRDLRKLSEHTYSRREALVETSRYMLSSFALAEIVDTPARSVSMWATTEAARGLPFGVDPTIPVFAGKILADHIYYGIVDPSVAFYNRRAEVRHAAREAQQALTQDQHPSVS